MFGLSMFGTLFLGAVLAAFLTLATVRGDAERGLLQPLVVRPIGRSTLLVGRFAAAALVCAVYVVLVYAGALLITWQIGDWTPDRVVGPAVAAGGRDRRDRSVLAPRLGLPLGHGQRHRGLHGLRRRAGRRPARPDRRGARLGDAHGRRRGRLVGASVRGALPGRPRRDHRRHERVHGGRAVARAVRRRPGRGGPALALDARIRRSCRRRRPRRPSPGRISERGPRKATVP